MIRARANPKRLILWHCFGTNKKICNLVQDTNWFDEHPIPVFKAPEEFIYLGDYIPNDGHKRTIASIMSEIDSVPILILENTADLSKTIHEQSRPYNEVYQNAINMVRESYKNPIMEIRLRSARGELY